MKAADIQLKINSFLDEKVVGLDQNIKIAVMVGLVIVPLLAFYLLSYKPQTAEMARLEKKKVGLLQTIRKVEAKAANIGKLRAEMAEAKLMFTKASNLLPQQQEIPALLANISDLGSNSGLAILSFKPGAERKQEFYAEIPISISMQGPYHNLGVFLDKVSKMSRIVSVSSLGIGTPKADEGEMILKATIQLETYRFVEPTPTAPSRKKKRKKVKR